MNNITKLKEAISNSPFKKRHYSVNIPIRDLSCSLMTYISEAVELKRDETLFDYGTPEFQRSRNVWSREMQISFVTNIFMGHKTEILLYEVGDTSMTDCYILDGLQRLTALMSFINGEFDICDCSFIEMQEANLIRLTTHNIILKIYTFDSEIDVVNFYIAINENITHDSNDIKKAKDYLQKLIQRG